ncbi:hypothetical protein BCV69DRAFT_280358 [Microstroma glucosiphilum]|uniref:Uncharacterized protein n=1 Tax=Pseudomicrostroma glucosiphilum TaxID=1684307 RepID=A0A316UED4_9BASI|nr:hypothetical protein BCV69DRAFT_280358 [Pseudomicrostroma glucosiphilum]PWN22751.1 hypothetical protein BCV69DRAFT_280358 [Pseudomicrostroma glucosiphilum]
MVISKDRGRKGQQSYQLDSMVESASQMLPFETIVAILSFVALAPPPLVEQPRQQPPIRKAKGAKTGSSGPAPPSPPWSILLLSKPLKAALEPVVYSRVSLTSTAALDRFARTLKERPDLNRKVKSLWIAPNSLESDFITTLKPADGINSLPSHLNEPLTHIRQILRACRAIRHVALDGCLCSAKAASSFGSNCQPLSLVSINPYSFLGGFSAPMFRKLRRLEMCDTSMASEEVEQIRNLQDLCHFVWTSPRDYSDSKRDISSLFRIITPSVSPSHLQLSVAGEGVERDALEEALPVKPHYHRHLRTVTIATERGHGAELGSKLKHAVDEQERRLKAYESGATQDLTEVFSALSLTSDRSALSGSRSTAFNTGTSTPYIDSSAHTSSIVHPSTGVELQTKPLRDESIIDEWECLRDLICGSGSIAAIEDMRRRRRERLRKAGLLEQESESRDGEVQDAGEGGDQEGEDEEEEIQPGLALRRLWIDWCVDASTGALEVPNFRA